MTGKGLAVAWVVAAVAAVAAAPAGAAQKLRAFDSCPSLVRYASAHASAATPLPSVTREPTTAAPAPTAESDAGAGGEKTPSDVSTTNVQEAGVDEPDVVKVDGGHLLAVANGVLYAIDARAATPKIVGSLTLPAGQGHELLVRDGRALAIARGPVSDLPIPLPGPVADGGRVAPEIMPYAPPTTVLAELDVRDPAAMRVVRTLTFDGVPVGSRLTGSTARVVVTSSPRYAVHPAARETVAGWVPTATLAGRGLAKPVQRRLVPCQRVRRPKAFSGTGLLTVLTVDVERGLPAIDSDAVMADADTVYAAPRGLYVATQRWEADQAAAATAIHRFDTAQADATGYDASGSVPGALLSQFALSEHEGVLRVASTRERDSIVTTLQPREGKLAQLGQVTGLGPDERIRGVRFLGPIGYVVTFRQTDPLYTVDLSDPAHPKVAGELKILGYSAYLHPIGDGLLLGIGQDATEQGRTLGTQVSLFDVSDPASPRRVDQRTFGSWAWSAAESDHHAFLWWPATRLAVLPVSMDGFSGALGLRVGRSAIADAGRATGPGGVAFSRATVVGERIFLVAPESGIQVASLDGLGAQDWIAFPSAPPQPVVGVAKGSSGSASPASE